MGNWSFSSRKEADGLKKIQTWWLKKNGYFDGTWRWGGIKWTNSWAGTETSIGITVDISEIEKYLRIHYTQTEQDGSKNDFDYKVQLTTTSCNYGGNRYWFICPLTVNGNYCGRRVGTLYKAGDYFGCRHCHNLTYESRNLSGLLKIIGTVTSVPELEELKKNVRCEYYKGKMTRRYRNYLKKDQKAERQMMMAVAGMRATKRIKLEKT